MFGTDLALPKGLTDFCEARHQAVAQMQHVLESIKTVQDTLEQVGNYLTPSDLVIRARIEDLTKQLDRSMWRAAFDHTGLMQLMDREEKRKFMDSCDHNPPPFTMENVRTTFLSVAQQADTMFKRGLVNVFLGLSKDHKSNTNEPFKVNERAVLCGMCQRNWRSKTAMVNYHSWASEKLNDIDRVFKTLDNQKHNPRSLENAVNAAFNDPANKNRYADSYYDIRGFMNGNMHIRFKRADLLEKANKLISEFYNGSALAGHR